MKKLDFQTSKELRLFFNEQFDKWKDRTEGNLRELAERCGVSPSYLSQVGRYGRVPGKPVMILLALNFELPDPSEIFRIAGVADEWPYAPRTVLRRDQGEDQSFVSLRVDLPGLTTSIRTIIRDELRQKGGPDLIGRRVVKIGLNPMQAWMFHPGTVTTKDGFFQEFCRLLAVAMQWQIELKSVRFNEYAAALARGDIDLYGPVMAVPTAPRGVHYSQSLFEVGVCALFRLRPSDDLETVKAPKRVDDLKDKSYQIAVLRNALPHLVANSRLGRGDEELVLCDSDDEARDRLLLRGIREPAHVFLCNALMANRIVAENPKEIQLCLGAPSFIDYEDTAIAIRPDWRDIVPVINDTLRFLLHRGGMNQKLKALFTQKDRASIRFTTAANNDRDTDGEA